MKKPSYTVGYTVVNQVFQAGYNIYYLQTPQFYKRGTIIYSCPHGAALAIDNVRSSSHKYSDRVFGSLARLNAAQNWAFYLRVISNSSSTSKQYALNNKAYSSSGTFPLTASLMCANGTTVFAQQIISVTNGKFKKNYFLN